MSYYFAKIVNLPFEEAVARVTSELKAEGFGVLTEIDVRAVLKKKLDIEVHDYRILGACNPQLAYRALKVDDKIGTMLPCNVIVQETERGIEVAAVDPIVSMSAVNDPELAEIAESAQQALKRVIDRL